MSAISTTEREPSSTKNSEPKQKGSLLLRAFIGCTVLWIIFFLISVDLFITTVRPLRYVHVQGVIFRDQDPIGEEVYALESNSNDANVLLFGTSLLHGAAGWADAVNEKISFTQYSWDRYLKANTFDSLLKSKFGLNAKSLDTYVGGGFFYDSWLLLKMAIDAGRHPALVVLTVAPKDFMDSTRTLDDSHVQYCLNLHTHEKHKFGDLQSTVDLFLSKVWTYYRMKSDYHTVSEVVACSWLHRPPTLFAALQTSGRQTMKQPSITVDWQDEKLDPMSSIPKDQLPIYIDYYKSVYNSMKPARLNEEFDYLNKAFALCKQHGISCIVINMPLSKFNRSLMPKEFEPFYVNKLNQICHDNQIEFINLMGDNRFISSDFRDYVHLNGIGAVKFWHVLCDQLAPNSKLLKSAFNSKPNSMH